MRAALGFLVVLAATGPARAESINVNFAEPGSTPSASYAAAGGAGMWNTVTGVDGPTFTLFATDGSATAVTLSQQPTTTLITTSDLSVSGDDAVLLDHGLVTTGAETCLTFSNMDGGTYEVLVYAWLPNQPTVKSRTRQDEAPSTIDVGGAWPGYHQEGVTYARYIVEVTPDGMLPAHSGLAPNMPAAALNGIQIRPLSSVGVDGTPPDAAPIVVDSGGSAGGAADNPDGGLASAGHHGGGCATGGECGPGAVVLALALALRRRRRT